MDSAQCTDLSDLQFTVKFTTDAEHKKWETGKRIKWTEIVHSDRMHNARKMSRESEI